MGMLPFKGMFETEDAFRKRMESPTKGLFEAEEHFRRRIANNGPPKGIWEADHHYRRRTQGCAAYKSARLINEHGERVAARCNEFPEFVGYGADEHLAKVDLLRVIDEKDAW